MIKISVYSSYSWTRVANNYGSILQYYALQTFLSTQGCTVEWIKYNHNKKNTASSRHHNIKGFKDFEKNHLNLTDKEYYSIYQIFKKPPLSDIYITGSDQVFAGFSIERYLFFAPRKSKKVAYAASFGKNAFSNPLKRIIYKILISNIKHLSLREESGVKFCHEIGRTDAQYVVDPSFLIDKKDYIKLIESYNFKELSRAYIYSYFVNSISNLEDVKWKDITNFCNNNNYDLKVTPIQGAEDSIPNEYIIHPSPVEWLHLIYKAKYVITNSFHGVAYSIIFRKNFLVIPQKGATGTQNIRFYDILKKFDLLDRIYNPNKNLKQQLDTPINWSNKEKEINSFIYNSKIFLINSIINNN